MSRGFLVPDKLPEGVSDFFKLIRVPNLLIIILTQYFTAIFLAGKNDRWIEYLLDPELFLLSLSTVLIAAAGYIINDYYDIKIDYLNKPEKVVIGNLLKRRLALAIHWLLNLSGTLLGFLVNIYLGIINLLAAFLLWLYSNHLKRLPFFGNLTVAFLTGLSLLVILVIYPQNHMLVIIYAIFAFFINLIREIIKDLEDWRGDEAFGCHTLPIVWGIRRTKTIVYLLLLLLAFLLGILVFSLENYFLKMYFAILVFPAVIFVWKLIFSDTKKDFHFLSRFSKWIMLSGIISMIFFKFLN